MKVIKIILSICLLIFLIAVLATALLNYLIDPNQLKPIIIEQVKKQTGSDLVIDGKLAWGFYPLFGVAIPHLTLTQAGEKTPYADLTQVKFAASLSQLWKKRTTLTGDIYIENAVIMRLHMTDLKFKMNWDKQSLTLNPLTGVLYAGNLNGKLQITPIKSNLQYKWDIQLNSIQLAPLLADLNGSNKMTLAGTAQMKLTGSSAGKNRDQLLQHLNGNLQFNVTNGAVTGIDLNYFVQTADALLNKQPISLNTTNQTTFDSFAGTATVMNGVMQSQDLLLTSPAFITQGQGNLSLIDQSINLKLQVKPQQSLKSQWQVPVLVTGTLVNPQVNLDTSNINKLLTQEQIKKVTTHVEEQVKKHISDKAGKFLQQLLGQ